MYLYLWAGQGAVLLDENGGFHQLPAPKGEHW